MKPRRDRTVRLHWRHKRRLNELLQSDEVPARVRVRAQVLLLSDRNWERTSIAEATGASISTVGRVRTNYCEEGLDAALFERPRPGAAPKLTDRQKQEVIALVCTDPPEGFARWSVRLLTEEVIRLGIAEPWSREPIRLLLRDHGLKPWREKNVVHPKARP